MALLVPKLSNRARKIALAHLKNQEDQILREYDYDHLEQKYTIHSTQRLNNHFEYSKELYNQNTGRHRSEVFNHVAHIPNLIAEKWMRQGISIFNKDHTPKILEMLDSPEYRWLRTRPGKLSKRRVRHFFRASTPSGRGASIPQGSLRLKQ